MPITEKDLLISAVEKQIELENKPSWNKELLTKAPPILWFGNTEDYEPKIITIGANPSRQEFLYNHRKDAQALIEKNKYEDLTYLDKPRFRTLKSDESLNDVIKNSVLQEEIIQSYNQYFYEDANPYTNWFGKYKGYKVEAFVNGLGASYYPNHDYTYTAIHVDLFPFATISDFNELNDIVREDLFNGWAQTFLKRLLKLLTNKSTIIVCFGRHNFMLLKELFSTEVSICESKKRFHLNNNGDQKSSEYWIGKFLDYDLVGLSVNLGNPRNFTIKNLNELGSDMRDKIKTYK